VQFNKSDFVILAPSQIKNMGIEAMIPDRFYLVEVIEDLGPSFKFDVLEEGPCAFVEALAISGCKKGQRVFLPPNHNPFGDDQ
jgi:hypothetical protein